MNYVGIIVIVIVVIIVIYFLLTYNKFVKLNNNVKEAFAIMDIYLKKRWDLIPNLTEIVKGYTKYEKKTLKEIVNLRNSVDYDNLSDNEKILKNTEISKNVTKLMGLVESYPDLKANENYNSLTEELILVEDEIAQSRKYYNAVVTDFNNNVEMIPANIVAKLIGYKSKQMFMAGEDERESVRV